MNEIKWDHRLAVSALHKSLRRADVVMAQFAAAFLMRYDLGGRAAWRRMMAFPAEDMMGAGAIMVAQNYGLWKESRCDEIAFRTVHSLCQLVRERGGTLDRQADELKNAAIAWNQGMRLPLPVLAGKWDGEIMPEMRYVGEFAAASSFIYQAMGDGQLEEVAQVGAWLLEMAAPGGGDRQKMARLAAWRPVIHFTFREKEGWGANLLSALHSCHQGSGEADNWFAWAISCLRDQWDGAFDDGYREGGRIYWREAIERVRTGDHPPIPSEVQDVHTGRGTLADWWAVVNSLSPASSWREDAMKAKPVRAEAPRNGEKNPVQPALIGD